MSLDSNSLHHDLKWLFEEGHAETRLKALKTAAARSGDRAGAVEQVFAGSRNPGETDWDNQHALAFHRFFTDNAVKIVRPLDENNRVLQEALTFWRQLLSLEPDEVTGFKAAVGSYNGTQESWNAVKAYLVRLGVGDWTPQHVDALKNFTRNEPAYSGLAWFGSPGDMW